MQFADWAELEIQAQQINEGGSSLGDNPTATDWTDAVHAIST